MKKFYLISAFFVFLFAVSLSAHPLGNFSFNQYSRLEVEKSRIKLRQVLDLAEIPTFQLNSEIDIDKDGKFSESEINKYAEKLTPRVLENLSLQINGQPINLRAESYESFIESGAGDLPTLKIKWNFVGDLENVNTVNKINFENKNYNERIGWNEIVVNRANGVNIFNSNVFGSGITEELKSYPQETLDAPLKERVAEFSFSTANIPENTKALQNRDGHFATPIQTDKLAALISVPEITPMIAFFGLLLAIGLGAMHAMSPGHGKTVVGAYLVGSRGTLKHAAFLGLTVTITHTIGVFALGFITLFASSYILPEKLIPFLSFFSGLIVLYIGLTLFKDRLFSALGWEKSKHNHHGHSHAEHSDESVNHEHDGFTHTHDGHTHSHLPPENISWKNLLGLGISGGLLPCPSALVLMLSAINLGRIGYGLILTLAFSFGLAATLTVVGLLFLYGGKLFGGSKLGQYRIVRALPVLSAFVIACFGAAICFNSL